LQTADERLAELVASRGRAAQNGRATQVLPPLHRLKLLPSLAQRRTVISALPLAENSRATPATDHHRTEQ
jgi:hypothetical protein